MRVASPDASGHGHPRARFTSKFSVLTAPSCQPDGIPIAALPERLKPPRKVLMDVTARREAVNLIIGALMLVAAAVTVTEAQERAPHTPSVSVGEHHAPAGAVEVALPGN